MPKIPKKKLKPYWVTRDKRLVRLYYGDVIRVLRRFPSRSVHCVVTSPPYWGLRSYLEENHGDKGVEIGSEKTPDEFVAKMVAVFQEVRRVLRDDGTVWLNLGDSRGGKSGLESGLPGGNLVGMPWRVALALQEDGWVLRQDIIWAKPNPMPESIRNRCTKSHDYIFLLTKKGSGYFCDMEAIKLKSGNWNSATSSFSKPRPKSNTMTAKQRDMQRTQFADNTHHPDIEHSTCNRRSVWTVEDKQFFVDWLNENFPEALREFARQCKNKKDVWRVATESFSGAHFATFPKNLILPCVLAGTSEKGCCVRCGAPWKRVTKVKKLKRKRLRDYVKRKPKMVVGRRSGIPGQLPQLAVRVGKMNTIANSVAGVDVKTVGWEPGCCCTIRKVIPCTVLDPFIGSGTTCCVALGSGRRSIGIDLSEEYLRENAVPRIISELLARPALTYQTGVDVAIVEEGELIS
ncbi:hypothetical protein LCGC14_0429030 [marine sediment metagenome]|uniref:site-specific DNA-methyltransferase (cytosine-N(4)-specific) n=1 Tax=marine sediment metagenome TaxID=412755 RepID=A0A0F9SNM8_9ZZZZ